MANVVGNASLERDADHWALVDLAEISSDYGASDGAAALRLRAKRFDLGMPSIDDVSAAFQLVNLTPGMIYSASFYYNAADARTDSDLTVKIDAGDGSLDLEMTLDKADVGAGWVRSDFINFSAVGTSGQIRFDVGNLSSDSQQWWMVDQVEVRDVGKTNDLSTALAADLAVITTGNGYTTEIDMVSTEPKATEHVQGPAAFIWPEVGGEAEVATLTPNVGSAEQYFTVQLFLRSATPHDDMEAFIDDARNAIERTASNVGGVAKVETWAVEEWSEVYVSEDVRNNIALAEVKVRIRYLYDRGSV